MSEWKIEDSKLFKGLNKLEIINKNDSSKIKSEKLSHNSKYWRYHNALAIAYIYQNVELNKKVINKNIMIMINRA